MRNRLRFQPLNSTRSFRFKAARFSGLLLISALAPSFAWAQCAGNVSTPRAAADCTAASLPQGTAATLDPNRSYSLAELIDLAEHNNPRTRIVWERAKQRAAQLGVAKSAYFPILAAVATFADERIINPFPKPLAPDGFTMVQVPAIQAGLELKYLLFDAGERAAHVDASTQEQIAAGANFIQANQEVAFRVASAYYRLLTAQERLVAAEETLKTARTTLDAAESRLNNGRATLPDVLNARSEAAQAVFDRESADGDEKIARVALMESIGAEPSPNIQIDTQNAAPAPRQLTLSIDALIDRALATRPDLMAVAAEIRAADDAIRAAKSEYKPKIGVAASVAQTSLWPTSSFGELGSASRPTWTAGLQIQWRLFDGGARASQVAAAESRRRQAQDEMTEIHDRATREVWTAYINFRSALRKNDAALSLLESATTSYSASLDAYNAGVRNLVDVVQAERQLAQARLSGVSARSQLFLEAVDLEFVTGNLLRTQTPATSLQTPPAAATQTSQGPGVVIK
jgi:outer membrane protein